MTTLTWRQIRGYLEFAGKLDRMDQANAVMNAAAASGYGSTGDPKIIEKRLKDLI
jgi:hypothetical protein